MQSQTIPLVMPNAVFESVTTISVTASPKTLDPQCHRLLALVLVTIGPPRLLLAVCAVAGRPRPALVTARTTLGAAAARPVPVRPVLVLFGAILATAVFALVVLWLLLDDDAGRQLKVKRFAAASDGLRTRGTD